MELAFAFCITFMIIVHCLLALLLRTERKRSEIGLWNNEMFSTAHMAGFSFSESASDRDIESVF